MTLLWNIRVSPKWAWPFQASGFTVTGWHPKKDEKEKKKEKRNGSDSWGDLSYQRDKLVYVSISLYLLRSMHLWASTVAQWERIRQQCGRCRRHRYNPWVRKIAWRKMWKPLQYHCLENPMDRGAWWAMVHRIAKSLAQLNWLSIACICIYLMHIHLHLCA